MTSPFLTLCRDVELTGIGLHSGRRVRARLCPRRTLGIMFARIDLSPELEIPASWQSISSTTHATTLGTGEASVSTTEHLLAALWSLGITHCRVELDGPEVPILDGSALEWCRLLESAGTEPMGGSPRPVYTLREPVWVEQGDASMLGLPHPGLRLTVGVDFGVPYTGRQAMNIEITPATFTSELAPARTFTLESWIAPLRAAGLIQGGSAENAIVLGAEAPSSPFRFSNELARHKAMDVLGDVALAFGENGGTLHAHLIALRAGHGTHRLWMEECWRRGALVAG